MLKLKSAAVLTALAALGFAGHAAAGPVALGLQYEISDQNSNVFTPAPDNGLYSGVSFKLNNTLSESASAGQFAMNYRVFGSGSSWTDFVAFCLQPNVYLTPFDNPYTAMTVNGAGYDLAKISELYGRFYSSVTNDTNAAAFQVALWELSYGDRNGNLLSGSFALTSGGLVLSTAQGWLNALNGSGPMDTSLLVLVNAHPTGINDRQDLITRVPEPAPLALFGIGLVALALIRRKRPASIE